MSMFLGIDAAASGLTAERLRMDVISNNIANANTTRTTEGGAYHRRYVIFEPRTKTAGPFQSFLQSSMNKLQAGDGVRATRIERDETQGPLVYDPGHPDANADGYVERPNINVVAEMVDMITASRAYEANTTTINAAKAMVTKALDMGK
ncbi:MAG: flagellar basal body rod protein FlgC [Selenomonas sp.]|jgi:flagellar basal-body rod protein FlgC|uniref:flagellar basal body rod protein FlgC n=1 Tax=Selenomonas sp. AE3005 TaxID=1485543 RepID=UPI0025CE8547|nr:flagellar basal body rod protein FlgC [Selenomonas sp. AE3005]MBQ1417051.1 flagellar basal body rod protein FlgC [Selenomonas sp.]MBQ1461642.1 flagellar basal body rod protein FlgC [Selenomonas sp.]MBQ1613108.1 flagellar basal body rod protein FlgC [Selenomonas sp.]MBQ1809481.1 flagellar basal body rod protein FlgC [Selenomonas sp.]MBQ1919257.1 flagellar basal body rod protein FlgC [Selenomonas sp.]